jgi:hypothetical protein
MKTVNRVIEEQNSQNQYQQSHTYENQSWTAIGQSAELRIIGCAGLGNAYKTSHEKKLEAAKAYLALRRREYVPFTASHPQGLSLVGIRETFGRAL